MMNDFFTWSTLGTYAGAVFATSMLTQLLKDIPLIAKVPTRIFSYIVAALLLLAVCASSGHLSWSCAALSLINAAVVALASNGAFEAVKSGGSGRPGADAAVDAAVEELE